MWSEVGEGWGKKFVAANISERIENGIVQYKWVSADYLLVWTVW